MRTLTMPEYDRLTELGGSAPLQRKPIDAALITKGLVAEYDPGYGTNAVELTDEGLAIASDEVQLSIVNAPATPSPITPDQAIMLNRGLILGRVVLPADHYFSTQAGIPLHAVASLGSFGDWAAYAGDSSKSSEQIRDHGDKLFAKEAAPLFPWLNPIAYRG